MVLVGINANHVVGIPLHGPQSIRLMMYMSLKVAADACTNGLNIPRCINDCSQMRTKTTACKTRESRRIPYTSFASRNEFRIDAGASSLAKVAAAFRGG